VVNGNSLALSRDLANAHTGPCVTEDEQGRVWSAARPPVAESPVAASRVSPSVLSCLVDPLENVSMELSSSACANHRPSIPPSGAPRDAVVGASFALNSVEHQPRTSHQQLPHLPHTSSHPSHSPLCAAEVYCSNSSWNMVADERAQLEPNRQTVGAHRGAGVTSAVWSAPVFEVGAPAPSHPLGHVPSSSSGTFTSSKSEAVPSAEHRRPNETRHAERAPGHHEIVRDVPAANAPLHHHEHHLTSATTTPKKYSQAFYIGHASNDVLENTSNAAVHQSFATTIPNWTEDFPCGGWLVGSPPSADGTGQDQDSLFSLSHRPGYQTPMRSSVVELLPLVMNCTSHVHTAGGCALVAGSPMPASCCTLHHSDEPNLPISPISQPSFMPESLSAQLFSAENPIMEYRLRQMHAARTAALGTTPEERNLEHAAGFEQASETCATPAEDLPLATAFQSPTRARKDLRLPSSQYTSHAQHGAARDAGDAHAEVMRSNQNAQADGALATANVIPSSALSSLEPLSLHQQLSTSSQQKQHASSPYLPQKPKLVKQRSAMESATVAVESNLLSAPVRRDPQMRFLKPTAELPWDSIQFHAPIGDGNEGNVLLAECHGMQVAVKVGHHERILKEQRMMSKLRHPHILRTLGHSRRLLSASGLERTSSTSATSATSAAENLGHHHHHHHPYSSTRVGSSSEFTLADGTATTTDSSSSMMRNDDSDFEAASVPNASPSPVLMESPHPSFAAVYEYCANKDLMTYLSVSSARTDVARMTQIFDDVLAGLEYIHEQHATFSTRGPIVHGDVKPENVMIDADGRAKLGDFGLAQYQSQNMDVQGTPSYIAPEVVLDFLAGSPHPKFTTKADIFSFGVLMVVALTGHYPFKRLTARLHSGDMSVAQVIKHFTPSKRALKTINDLSPRFKRMVDACLCRYPEMRPNASMLRSQLYRRSKSTGETTAIPIIRGTPIIVSTAPTGANSNSNNIGQAIAASTANHVPSSLAHIIHGPQYSTHAPYVAIPVSSGKLACE